MAKPSAMRVVKHSGEEGVGLFRDFGGVFIALLMVDLWSDGDE